MIYKNYILDKKLSGLDIYLVFFCLLLVSLLDVFFMLISLLVYFFVNYGGLLMQIVIFVFSIFVFYFNLVGINQKYMLLTYLKKKDCQMPNTEQLFYTEKSSHQRFSIKTLFLKFCNIYRKTPV